MFPTGKNAPGYYPPGPTLESTIFAAINRALKSWIIIIGGIAKQTEVDFGATPVSSGTFVIAEPLAVVGSVIVASVAYDAPTGKDLDEVEMDDLQIRAGNAGVGTFEMFIQTADGSYLADKFKINYTIK